ncbi:MAG: SpoIIE family protein phosphatase [Ignavibacteriales bacterium]|nr:SpoIIE family protein phosphatase [Ignavibacteriales bacterium]
MMEKLKPILPFFVLAAVAIAVIVMLSPTTHPYGGTALPLNDEEMIELSKKTLQELNIDVSALSPTVQLRVNRKLVRQAQEKFGIEQSNKLLRESIPGYVWEVKWRKEKPLEAFLGGGGDEGSQAKKVIDALMGEVYLKFDTRGRLLGLDRKISDSTQIPSVSSEQAKEMARSFVKRFSTFEQLQEDTNAVDTSGTALQVAPKKKGGVSFSFSDDSEKKIERPHRTAFNYTWTTKSRELDDKVVITVGIEGNIVAKYETQYETPVQKNSVVTIHQVVIILAYVVIIILMLIFAFKRIRSFEIGFRVGMIVGIIAAVVFGTELYLTLYKEAGWEIIFPVLFGPLFMGGSLILIWAVSESTVRETWKEKFVTIDLLSKGHFIHSRIGENIIRGLTLGIAGFAAWLVLLKLAGYVVPLWIGATDDNPLQLFTIFTPALYVLGHSFFSNMFVISFYVMFLVSLLRKRISSPTILILIGAVILALLNRESMQPLAAGMLIQLVIGAIVVWTFYRYDTLAAFLTLFAFSVTKEASELFMVGHPTLVSSGYALAGFFGLLLVGSVASLYRKKEITDFDSITPAFARHITERQRLQQELEIARQVQMSFLPKANPTTYRLDIASRCAPALEVGGDYYDFIELGSDRLGVAVGDVSGKGTQAAFFMTLTKGFLRALAKVSNSPSSILSQVNKLFYENVERGVFISMVYGIFDTKQHTITLARAGHNPVIMRSTTGSNVQVVNPMGLALGLDAGDAFSKSIQEVTIPFQQGDLFVFYTDGFPEAMNKTMEEFGEERLCQTVQQLAQNSAAQIIDNSLPRILRQK